VVRVTGTRVLLADQQGRVTTAALPVLAAAADFALVDRHEPAGLPPLGTLEGLAPEAVEAARWWERHILEVLHGHDPQAAPGLAPRPEYEPSRHSLSQRERAKAAELTAAGHQVSASTVKHRRQRYQSQGMVGLVDHRIDKKISVFGRSDPRVVRAMRIAIGEASDSSSRTAGFILWRSEQILVAEHGPSVVALPARRTLYRLFNKLAHGLHTTGTARSRRSLASSPQTPFGELPAGAPGELMQIDSTPLDVLVRSMTG
jgi:hypothetical protein